MPQRFRTTRRLLVALIAIGSVSLIAYFFPGWWGHYLYAHQVRSLQQQCLTHAQDPSQIVYDTDPADRAKLLALGPEYRAFNDWSVFHVPAAWHDFRGSYDCPDGTAFVHARTSPAGYQRLVAVDIVPTGKASVELRGSVVDLAPRFDLKKLESCRRSMGPAGAEWAARKGGYIRIYAGQIDPNDASRFTIAASFGEGMIEIRCQLRDDDTVDIQR